MTLERILNLPDLLKKKSFFLFGPRSSGKSTLIKQQLQNEAFVIDLLHGATFLRLSASPSDLEEICDGTLAKNKIIVIDEIQKIPPLLDEVHRLIENKKRRFLLTGSSARKLRANGVNLLAGRAWEAQLFPLVSAEIKNFDLDRCLRFGTLPQVFLSEYPQEELSAYVQTYLREEIQMEGLVRKIPAFARFLKVAALSNGQLINYSAVGSDAGVSASTVREYFSILNDTLVGFLLEPWRESKKRKAIETSKFYFFDCGVTHTLAETQTLDRNSDLYGNAFEQWIGLELRAYLSYRRKLKNLKFWRSVSGQEVDFLMGEEIAIEAKATKKISNSDLKGLIALREEDVYQKFICVSNDPLGRSVDGIQCYHWRDFVRLLWNDEI